MLASLFLYKSSSFIERLKFLEKKGQKCITLIYILYQSDHNIDIDLVNILKYLNFHIITNTNLIWDHVVDTEPNIVNLRRG